MKALILLAAFLAVSTLAPTRNLSAEPYARVYFDHDYMWTSYPCPGFTGQFENLYVVIHDLDMFVSGVEFRVFYPPSAFLLLAEETPFETLVIGNSGTGISIVWQTPQNGFEPLLALTMTVIWRCDCNTFYEEGDPDGVKWIRVEPAFDSNRRVAVRWPDYAEIEIGYKPSLIGCLEMATEQTTWGRVKALYR